MTRGSKGQLPRLGGQPDEVVEDEGEDMASDPGDPGDWEPGQDVSHVVPPLFRDIQVMKMEQQQSGLVYLEGPEDSGKTLSLFRWLGRNKRPWASVQACEFLTVPDLFGMWIRDLHVSIKQRLLRLRAKQRRERGEAQVMEEESFEQKLDGGDRKGHDHMDKDYVPPPSPDLCAFVRNLDDLLGIWVDGLARLQIAIPQEEGQTFKWCKEHQANSCPPLVLSLEDCHLLAPEVGAVVKHLGDAATIGLLREKKKLSSQFRVVIFASQREACGGWGSGIPRERGSAYGLFGSPSGASHRILFPQYDQSDLEVLVSNHLIARANLPGEDPGLRSTRAGQLGAFHPPGSTKGSGKETPRSTLTPRIGSASAGPNQQRVEDLCTIAEVVCNRMCKHVKSLRRLVAIADRAVRAFDQARAGGDRGDSVAAIIRNSIRNEIENLGAPPLTHCEFTEGEKSVASLTNKHIKDHLSASLTEYQKIVLVHCFVAERGTVRAMQSMEGKDRRSAKSLTSGKEIEKSPFRISDVMLLRSFLGFNTKDPGHLSQVSQAMGVLLSRKILLLASSEPEAAKEARRMKKSESLGPPGVPNNGKFVTRVSLPTVSKLAHSIGISLENLIFCL